MAKSRWTTTAKVAVALVLVAVAVVAGCSGWQLGLQKHGRLVDGSTGKPIAGAWLVATYWKSGSLYHAGYNTCVATSAAISAGDGSFDLPSVVSDVATPSLNTPGGGYSWRLTVFKPGFVPVGGNAHRTVDRPQEVWDEKEQRKVYDPVHKEEWYPWQDEAKPPTAATSAASLTTEVGDLRLEPATLPVGKHVEYLQRVLADGVCPTHPDVYVPLRKAVLQATVDTLCSAPPGGEVNAGILLYIVSANGPSRGAELESLLPPRNPLAPTYPSLPAGQLCDILRTHPAVSAP